MISMVWNRIQINLDLAEVFEDMGRTSDLTRMDRMLRQEAVMKHSVVSQEGARRLSSRNE